LLLIGLAGGAAAQSSLGGKLELEDEGGFFVNARKVPSAYPGASFATGPAAAGSITVNQMYVHYRIPAGPKGVPLVLVHGWVIVGNLPSKNGQAATSSPGCLLVLDSSGKVRKIFSGHGINGPWDATAVGHGRSAALFVTNVLNGTVAAHGGVVHRGTVLRIVIGFGRGQLPAIRSVTKVGSGFAERTDPAAFVVGPTGLGLNRNGTLYVADTAMNRITQISQALVRHSSAGTGTVLTSGGKLNAPLGMTIAPNGDVLTVNANDGRIVETSPSGMQVASRFLDRSGSPPGSGALFGLTLAPASSDVYYVDDAANTLRLLH